jgi:hypothetical protein
MILEVKKKLLLALGLAVAIVPIIAWAVSKQPSAEVPVWLTMYTRTFPGKFDAYVGQMQLLLVPVLEEDKRQGGLLDYKVLRKIDTHGADDWNIELVVIFKSHAQMDGYRARWNAISDKINAGREEVDRNQMRVDVGADLLEEIHSN